MILDTCRFQNWLKANPLPVDVEETIQELVVAQKDCEELQDEHINITNKNTDLQRAVDALEDRLNYAKEIFLDIKATWEKNPKCGPWPERWKKTTESK